MTENFSLKLAVIEDGISSLDTKRIEYLIERGFFKDILWDDLHCNLSVPESFKPDLYAELAKHGLLLTCIASQDDYTSAKLAVSHPGFVLPEIKDDMFDPTVESHGLAIMEEYVRQGFFLKKSLFSDIPSIYESAIRHENAMPYLRDELMDDPALDDIHVAVTRSRVSYVLHKSSLMDDDSEIELRESFAKNNIMIDDLVQDPCSTVVVEALGSHRFDIDSHPWEKVREYSDGSLEGFVYCGLYIENILSEKMGNKEIREAASSFLKENPERIDLLSLSVLEAMQMESEFLCGALITPIEERIRHLDSGLENGL